MDPKEVTTDSLSLYPRNNGTEGCLYIGGGARAHHRECVPLQDIGKELGGMGRHGLSTVPGAPVNFTVGPTESKEIHACPVKPGCHRPCSSTAPRTGCTMGPHSAVLHDPNSRGCSYLPLPIRGVDKNDVLRELVIGNKDVIQLIVHSLPGDLQTPNLSTQRDCKCPILFPEAGASALAVMEAREQVYSCPPCTYATLDGDPSHLQ